MRIKIIFVYFMCWNCFSTNIDTSPTLDENGDNLLHIAVERNNLKFVKLAFYSKKIDINSRGWNGNTALHYAIHSNFREEILKFLLENNANINALNDHRETPILCAVRKGICGAVYFLLKHWASPSIPDYDGMTCLHEAVADNNSHIVRALLKSCNIDDVRAKNSKDETPLHYAAKYAQSVELVKMLVNSRASILAENIYKETPMHLAMRNLDESIPLYLLNVYRKKSCCGVFAELDLFNNCLNEMLDSDGRSLLHLAIMFDKHEVAKILVRIFDVSLRTKDSLGNAPTHYTNDSWFKVSLEKSFNDFHNHKFS